MFDREKIEILSKLNEGLGTQHRTKPYDMKNPADLEHALLYATAAYRDYWHYANMLSGLTEDFDESLELYDPIAWITRGSDEENNLVDKGMAALSDAWSVFDEFAKRAKEHCTGIIKIILSILPEIQRTVFGKAYKIAPNEIDFQIEELFDALDEADYFHPIHENRDMLLTVMKEQWASFE